MSKKILTRFNIQTELLELIQTQANQQNISKHDYLNQLLYDKLIKKDNRLSHHIARDIENLILLLLTNEKKFENIPAVFQEADQIDRVKREFLSLRRNTQSKSAKTMWAKLMKELAPSSFKTLKSRDEAIEKLKAIYDIVAGHQEIFE
ncbi:MAG: hypothetical protein PHO74_06715 [Weeksellaceae bacterium]|nr:hypothetical protein [Weeksellaceae bacterium]